MQQPANYSATPRKAAVELCEHRADWLTSFQEESALLLRVCKEARRVEHIGSTAVPGLPAKPIIDILVGTDARDTDDACASLIAIDYTHVGQAGVLGRDFLYKYGSRSFHVHVTVMDSAFWRDRLLFRDLLRADPVLAAAYADLKQHLAGTRDTRSYTAAKGPFVLDALARYRAGASASSLSTDLAHDVGWPQ